MHRVEALISGIQGCANGTVSAVIRGTSTPATYYSDFEGTSSGTATALALDQYGGRVLFFDRPVTITAYSSGGSIVRTWTAGDDAGAVELKSQSFTGTPYAGGGAVAGGPTTVEAAFDKWFDSAGATDFKVDINGVATDIDVALSGVAGLRYYVVTDDAYGAVGDGVTNDLTAVQAAINAANAAGGGVVFFPPGTFRISGTLTTYSTVAFLGYHRDLSIIRVVSTTATLLSGPYPRSIESLKFTFVTTPYTGTLMDFTVGASRCVIRDISVGTSISDTPVSGTIVSGGAATVTIEVRDSQLFTTHAGVAVTGGAGVAVYALGNFGSSYGSGAFAGTYYMRGSSMVARNNRIWVSGTSGTKIVFSGSGSLYATSNEVLPSSDGITVFETDSNGFVAESGNNYFDNLTNIVLYGPNVLASTSLYQMRLASRLGYRQRVSGDTDPVVIAAHQAGLIHVRTTTSAGWSGNCNLNFNLAPPGHEVIVQVWNDTAGALTYEWGTNVANAAATFAVAANSMRSFKFVSSNKYPTSTTLLWYLVSDTAGAEVAE